MWVNEGKAFSDPTIFLLGVLLILWAFFYQAPGPVSSLVLTPDLKSGIPQAVEIPAPVKAMKCLELIISFAKISIFSFSYSDVSKNSFLSS